MTDLMNNYRSGKNEIVYPEKIRDNVHAQAFYGVISSILNDAIPDGNNTDKFADLSADITEIISKKIFHALDNLSYDYSDNNGWDLDYDTIDMIIDNVKTIALRRF